jgi:hypothetical protein
MPAPRKYPNEPRERAQRMVVESMSEDPALTLNGAVSRIGPRVGVVPDTDPEVAGGWGYPNTSTTTPRPSTSTPHTHEAITGRD